VKSKDIDIIVDFPVLDRLKAAHGVKKNAGLRKYETAVDGASVDIYVPHYSSFPVPPEDIKGNCTSVEGFRVVRPEVLLLLKQKAEMDRHDSVKGQKDRVDILNLLINAGVDFGLYMDLVKKNRLDSFPKHLKGTVKAAKKEFTYLGIENPRRAKLLKAGLLKQLSQRRQLTSEQRAGKKTFKQPMPLY
jgi:hypothetical protein